MISSQENETTILHVYGDVDWMASSAYQQTSWLGKLKVEAASIQPSTQVMNWSLVSS
jgi:hypothetical protein